MERLSTGERGQRFLEALGRRSRRDWMVRPVTRDHHYPRGELAPGPRCLEGQGFQVGREDSRGRQKGCHREPPGLGNWPGAPNRLGLVLHPEHRGPKWGLRCFPNRRRDRAHFWKTDLGSNGGVAPLLDHPLHSEGETETNQHGKGKPMGAQEGMRGGYASAQGNPGRGQAATCCVRW